MAELSSLLETVHIAKPHTTEATRPSFTTKEESFILNNVQTDIVINMFSDRVFVTISQLNKIGNMLYATSEDSSLEGKDFEVKVLLGRRDDPLLMLYARQLIEQISKSSNLPLLLAISLTEEGRGTNYFEATINKVLQMRCW